jgi:hypothetical protein
MGVIRKTLSISTFGIVNWRSKKERLRRAEADLEITSKKEQLLKERLLEAERRAEAAEAEALRTEKRSSRRKAKAANAARAAAALEVVRTAGSSVADTARETKSRVAADLEPALAGAEKRAAELQKRSRKARRRAAKKSAKARRQITAAASDASAKVREKAGSLGS